MLMTFFLTIELLPFITTVNCLLIASTSLNLKQDWLEFLKKFVKFFLFFQFFALLTSY